MVSLLACKHYKYSDKYTVITQGDNMPWNGWLKAYKGNILIYNSYITGLFSSYLYHLKNSPECRKEVGVSLSDILEFIDEMEREWEHITRRDC